MRNVTEASLNRVLRSTRILPVLTINNAPQLSAVSAGLQDGGIPLAEVTLRSPFALDAIRALSKQGVMAVGAGTVLVPSEVDQAVEAGASFIVSPGLSLSVLSRCQELEVPLVPGVATPSEILAAYAVGVRTMKFFPASVYGGPAALKAFAGPFPDVKFVATGGINGQNYASYLTLSNVLAVGGSWFAPEDGSAENIATEVRALLAATASGTVQPTPSSVEVRA